MSVFLATQTDDTYLGENVVREKEYRSAIVALEEGTKEFQYDNSFLNEPGRGTFGGSLKMRVGRLRKDGMGWHQDR